MTTQKTSPWEALRYMMLGALAYYMGTHCYGCSQQVRRPPTRQVPPPADYRVDILPVIVGEAPRWTEDRMEASLATLAPAWAEARIVPSFLPTERVDGPETLEMGELDLNRLQYEAYKVSDNVVVVHFCQELLEDDTYYGGMAYLPTNAPGKYQHGIFVSSYGIPSTFSHELSHHLGMRHADTSVRGPPYVPQICVHLRDCEDLGCAANLMSYCGRAREPTGSKSLTKEQEELLQYWAHVRRAFRPVSEKALRRAKGVPPKFTQRTTPVICGE